MDMKQLDLPSIFKALGNAQRLRLFRMIHAMGTEAAGAGRGGGAPECCAVERAFTHGCECVDLARSTVSHHLAALRRAGLITCTREGRVMQCVVNPRALEAVRGFLAG